jgi:hypothetical protein
MPIGDLRRVIRDRPRRILLAVPTNGNHDGKEEQTVLRNYEYSDAKRRQQELLREAELRRLMALAKRSEQVSGNADRGVLRLRVLWAR